MAERFTAPDWEREHLLAGFDRFHWRLVEWARTAPPWPPFAAAEGLISRLEPRLRVPEIDLDRALVIGFLGGSGTGKSTQFALIGGLVTGNVPAVRFWPCGWAAAESYQRLRL